MLAEEICCAYCQEQGEAEISVSEGNEIRAERRCSCDTYFVVVSILGSGEVIAVYGSLTNFIQTEN